MNRQFFLPVLFFLCAVCSASLVAESFDVTDAEPLADFEANKITPTDSNTTIESENDLSNKNSSSVTIKTNVSDAYVYLNGNFQGKTPITILNLAEGRYQLRIEKKNFLPYETIIVVSKGRNRVYQIDMHRPMGVISFTVLPAESTILCDGISVDASYLSLEEGMHTFTVKCFGYKTWSSSIEVFRYSRRQVHVELDKAPFEIASINCSRNTFNPRNPGVLGETDIQFSVTAPASGILIISNEAGTELWQQTYTQFTTWNYSSSWNGRTANGDYAPDGRYTATLTAGDKSAFCSFIINSAITYPQLTVSYSGTGIGSVASAELFPTNTMLFCVTLGPDINITGKSFYGAPFSLQFAWSLTKWCEFSFSYSYLFGSEKIPSFSTALKFGGTIPLAYNTKLCLAANIRGGFSEGPFFAPYGVDTGSGVGTGLLLGITTGRLYAGLESEYIYGPVMGITKDNSDWSWKNGIVARYSTSLGSIGAYALLGSCFGSYSYTEEDSGLIYTGSVKSSARVVDTGIQGTLFFKGSSVSSLYRAGTIWYPGMTDDDGRKVYLYGTFGITVLF